MEKGFGNIKIKKGEIRNYESLVCWLFVRMVDVLNSPAVDIRVVFGKINKSDYKDYNKVENSKLAICTLLGGNKWAIKIEKRASKSSYARTFFHEVCHIFFDQFFFNNECSIEDIEDIVGPLLSKGQKQVFKELMYKLKK